MNPEKLPNILGGITSTLFVVIENVLEKGIVSKEEISVCLQEVIAQDKIGTPNEGISVSARIIEKWANEAAADR